MNTPYQKFIVPTREEIATSADVEQLLAWHAECCDVADSTRSQLEGRLASETAEDDWLIRAGDKLAIVATTARRRLIRDLRDILEENGIAGETAGRN